MKKIIYVGGAVSVFGAGAIATLVLIGHAFGQGIEEGRKLGYREGFDRGLLSGASDAIELLHDQAKRAR